MEHMDLCVYFCDSVKDLDLHNNDQIRLSNICIFSLSSVHSILCKTYGNIYNINQNINHDKWTCGLFRDLTTVQTLRPMSLFNCHQADQIFSLFKSAKTLNVFPYWNRRHTYPEHCLYTYYMRKHTFFSEFFPSSNSLRSSKTRLSP